MNYSTYRFTLDIHRTKSQVSIPVRLHDTGIKFYISLSDGGKPYFIEDGCRAVFSAKKPDGTQLFNDCIIEDNTRIRYDFTTQTTNSEGMMNCEIRLYGTDGDLITTPAFVVVVDPRVIYDSDVIESHPESTSLDNIIAAERARIVAEQQRVDAEAVRVIVENARAVAEGARAEAETARYSAEKARVAGEEKRKANEAERVSAFASMIGSWVAYSAYEDGTDYTYEWSEGQRYIGIRNGKTPPQSKEDFVWSKFVDTGIYVGSGEMPSWCDLQIDPDGEVTEISQTPGQSPSNIMSQKVVSDAFANALKGNASGEAVALDDVSPIEHELSVKVRSKNIVPMPYKDAYGNTITGQSKEAYDSATGFAWKINDDYSVSLKGIPSQSRDTTIGLSYSLSAVPYVGKTLSVPETTGSVGFYVQLFYKDGTVTYNFLRSDKSNSRAKVIPENASHFEYGIVVKTDFTGEEVTMYPQMEEGATATAYAPYIADISKVTVSRYEKNLLPYPYYETEKTASGVTFTVNDDGSITVEGTPTKAVCLILQKNASYGDKTIWETRGGDDFVPSTNGSYTCSKRIRFDYSNGTVTLEMKLDDGFSGYEVFYPQIEVGTVATEYEPYKEPVTHSVGADGVAKGVTSIYPNTTLLTDPAGAVIDVEYNRDANKVVAELATRIAALETAALN